MGVVAVVNPDEESGGGGTGSPKDPRRAGEVSAGAATSTCGVLGELGNGAPSSRYSSSICWKGTLVHVLVLLEQYSLLAGIAKL